MKNILRNVIPFILFVSPFLFNSCQKEYSCEDCNPLQKPPIANAGRDTTISLPNNTVILNGSASSDPDGNIVSFLWTKISGPSSFNLKNPNAAQSTADSLKKGVYQFELKVTDAAGLFDTDTVKITVNESVQINRTPVANAGDDAYVTLPNNSIALDGSASHDPDNNIVAYNWTKISGPSSFVIANTTEMNTQVSGLSEGIYQFELQVTDAEGLLDRDTVMIEVKEIKYALNVCFYAPDPTGTISYATIDFSPPVHLITVTINNLSDSLCGVWGSGYSPRCPLVSDYYIIEGVNSATFKLPPGTYNWTAQSTIYDLSRYSDLTNSFIQYWLIPHAATGTITVKPGDNCIIQKIVFP